MRWSKASFSQAERSVAGRFIRNFSADEIAAFARAFGLPITWFFMPPLAWAEPGVPARPETPDAEQLERELTLLIDLFFGDEEGQGLLDSRLNGFLDQLGTQPLTTAQQRIASLVGSRVAALVRHSFAGLEEWRVSLRSIANQLEDLETRARGEVEADLANGEEPRAPDLRGAEARREAQARLARAEAALEGRSALPADPARELTRRPLPSVDVHSLAADHSEARAQLDAALAALAPVAPDACRAAEEGAAEAEAPRQELARARRCLARARARSGLLETPAANRLDGPSEPTRAEAGLHRPSGPARALAEALAEKARRDLAETERALGELAAFLGLGPLPPADVPTAVAEHVALVEHACRSLAWHEARAALDALDAGPPGES